MALERLCPCAYRGHGPFDTEVGRRAPRKQGERTLTFDLFAGVIPAPEPIGVKEIEKVDSTPKTQKLVILRGSAKPLILLPFRQRTSVDVISSAAKNDEKGDWEVLLMVW